MQASTQSDFRWHNLLCYRFKISVEVGHKQQNGMLQEAEREQERQAMRAAKQEWQLRQMEAFRNRKQVESDRADPPPRPSPIDAPPVYAPSAPRRPVLPSEWQQGYADRQVLPSHAILD